MTSFKRPLSCYCTEVDFKANPGKWKSSTFFKSIQQVLQISSYLDNEMEKICEILHLVSNLLLRCLAAISGRGSPVPYHGEGKAEKHDEDWAVLWLLMIIDHVWLWAMLLCSNLLSFMSQIQRSMLLPWADVLELSSLSLCRLF